MTYAALMTTTPTTIRSCAVSSRPRRSTVESVDSIGRARRIPARELWLWQTPAAIDSALRGLEQARRGEFAQWGSFEGYAEMDVDE